MSTPIQSFSNLRRACSSRSLIRIAGFTLIEMLVVISIIAIIMLVAVPSMNGVVQANRLTSSGDQLLSLIGSAEQLVASDGRPVEVRFLQYDNVGGQVGQNGSIMSNFQTVLLLRHYSQYEMGPDFQQVTSKEGISVLAADPLILPNGIVISASTTVNTTDSSTACITDIGNGLVIPVSNTTVLGDLMMVVNGRLVPYNLTFLGNVSGTGSTLSNFCSFTIYSEGTSLPNPALNWYFMLVDEKDEANPKLSFSGLKNFYCIQIDPYCGHPTSYRP